MSGFNNKPEVGQRLADNIMGNFAGMISTKKSAQYASGARCLLKINGVLVGFAFGISWSISTAAMEIQTIDDPLAYELAPTRMSIEGSISALHIPGTSPGTLLWQPDNLNFLLQRYITIEVRDSATDQLLFATDRAFITTRTEEIKVDSLASVSLTWKAVGYRDEREPQLPQDLSAPAAYKPGLFDKYKPSNLFGLGNIKMPSLPAIPSLSSMIPKNPFAGKFSSAMFMPYSSA